MTSTSCSRLVGCLAAAFLAGGVACGGSSGIDLFTNADGGPGGPGGNEAGTASSSGSSGSSGVTTDGGGREGGASGGTRPGGDTSSIPCGDGSCTLATQVCCLTSAGTTGGQGATFACLAGTTCPPPPPTSSQNENPSVALKCTSAANCGAGTVCCVSRTDTAVVAECAASCTGDQAQLCDRTAATTGCSASEPCSSDNIREWRLPSTFATCGGKGN